MARVAWLLTGAIAVAVAPGGADWPQFLGPARDGRSPDRVLVPGWLERGLRERWRRPVGEGYASVVVVGERLYSMDADGASEFVFSRRVSDGSELWRVRMGSSPRDVYGGLGPRVTPTFDRGALYLTTAELDLVALRADDGRVLWRRALRREVGARPPAEGHAAAVLVEGERLFAVVGGSGGRSVAAFDRATGKPLWSALDDRASYSSPVALTLGGRRQLLFLTATHLRALDPDTGTPLWSHSWPTYDGINVATPLLVAPDRVFLSAGYDQGAVLLRVRPGASGLAASEVWRNKAMKNHFNNSVLHGGTLYGFDSSLLKAVDAASGRTAWAERGFGKGSLIVAAGHLIVLGEDGELALVRADPARRRARTAAGAERHVVDAALAGRGPALPAKRPGDGRARAALNDQTSASGKRAAFWRGLATSRRSGPAAGPHRRAGENRPRPRDQGEGAGSRIVTFISTRSLALSPSAGVVLIWSTISMPETTSPKTLYWPARAGCGWRQTKNCVPALSRLEGRRTAATVPRTNGRSESSAFSRPRPPVPYCDVFAGSLVSGSPPWMIPPMMTRWKVVPS
jgi:outer membrane protein assembly factor BamB